HGPRVGTLLRCTVCHYDTLIQVTHRGIKHDINKVLIHHGHFFSIEAHIACSQYIPLLGSDLADAASITCSTHPRAFHLDGHTSTVIPILVFLHPSNGFLDPTV